jgi:hypothetical protein
MLFRVLNKSRMPLFLHKKSNHIFTCWQHITLLAIRQYEGKSYRMFVEWLVEAYYLRTFMHPFITYSTLYYPSKVCCQNNRYYIGKNNLLLYIVTRQYHKKDIHKHRFVRIQTIQCFRILYRQGKLTTEEEEEEEEEEEISKIINWSNNMRFKDKESSNKT